MFKKKAVERRAREDGKRIREVQLYGGG